MSSCLSSAHEKALCLEQKQISALHLSRMSGTLEIFLEVKNDLQMKACEIGKVTVMIDRGFFKNCGKIDIT